ncbi:hypothetical protein Nmel_010894, partial [Mimus melanotis]
MVISQSEWPTDWTLAPGAEVLSGIGGNSSSFRSMGLVKLERPEGCIDTTRPFVVRTENTIVLWGRDFLFQSGICLKI